MKITTDAVAFNPAELSTWNQAEKFLARINASRAFQQAGITITEIYLPSWISGPGGFPEPAQGNAKWWHYKFSNGFSGVNVGLVIAEFQRYPAAPLYVFNWLLQQVQG